MARARSGSKGRAPKRVGLFGGTFNPVHWGHLTMAASAAKELGLDEVVFLPCSRPALKGSKELLPGRTRLQLLRGAVKGRKGFRVDPREIKRGGTSYTIDTLKDYKKKHGKRVELFFLLGPDAALELPLWKDSGQLVQYARFCVFRRKTPQGKAIKIPLGLKRKFSLGFIRTPVVPISSSMIRQLVKEGKDVSNFIPFSSGRF